MKEAYRMEVWEIHEILNRAGDYSAEEVQNASAAFLQYIQTACADRDLDKLYDSLCPYEYYNGEDFFATTRGDQCAIEIAKAVAEAIGFQPIIDAATDNQPDLSREIATVNQLFEALALFQTTDDFVLMCVSEAIADAIVTSWSAS